MFYQYFILSHLMSVAIKERTMRNFQEIILLIFFAIALFFLLALITFNNEDAGWTHSGSIPTISNACGVVGAWMADFIFSIFGLMGYLFPIMILWHGYLVFTQTKQLKAPLVLSMRWLGFLLTIVSGSAIFSLHILRLKLELPRSTGGILGQEIGDALSIILGDSGATLAVLAVFLAGITFLTGLSWLSLFEWVGKYTLLLTGIVYRWFILHYEAYQDNRLRSPQTTKIKQNTSDKPAKIKISPTINRPEPSHWEIKNRHNEQTEELVHSESLKGQIPPIDLLDKRTIYVEGYSVADLTSISRQVENVLQDFNVVVEVVAVSPGPVITRFELKLAAGIKVSKVSGLAKDIARGLSVSSVRIVEVIQGKSVIGLEIPNREREMVCLHELIASSHFEQAKSKLTFAMGKDIAGIPVVSDLGKMPHVLVAGTTGSGKSVAINTMILSLLYKATPEQVRLIMIDPKMLELSVYEGIPHLLSPVVTDMKDAQNALRWAVAEMERRYKLMSKLGVRSLAGFNQLVKLANEKGEPIRDPLFQLDRALEEDEEFPLLTALPSIVIVIDELADMMMVIGKKVEELIARLAQKARAAGIHLVLATQRPSVDVLTGLIKANVPTRISFQVSSRIDSRTILDQGGAEALLGNGDMLFLPSGTSIPLRAHGAFVDDHEVHKVVEFLKTTAPTDYRQEITQECSDGGDLFTEESDNAETDVFYDEAVQFVTESRKASISSIQRRFKVGYNRAASIIEAMEIAGVVSATEGNGSRQVLAPRPL